MRTFWKWAVLALTVPAGGMVAAQPADQVAPEGTTVPLLLLRQKSVQQELKLTPDVAKKVADFTSKDSEEYAEALKLHRKERRAKIEKLERENKRFLQDNLTPAQHKRLDQITLQVTGLHQLTRPEVAKVLKLTKEQQHKFREMAREDIKELRAIMNAPNRAGRNEKLAKLREDMDKRIEALLTDEQKAKVRELVGEPFKGELLFEDPGPEK
jgi:hypothetical protein